MKIACINYEPITAYRDQGWSCERLGRYYNPCHVAEEACIFAYGDSDWQVTTDVRVVGFRSFAELKRECKAYKPDVIRCYEAFRPFADYALILSLDLGVPSYLSLHDARIRHYRRLASYTTITAYTETLATKVARELKRDIEIQRNGINSNLFRPKDSSLIDERIADARYRVFTVGRTDPVKNIDTVMQATALLSAKYCSLAHVLVGPGTERIPYDGVHLGQGPTTDNMIVEYLNWCDCFLQVQLVADLGMAATEALMVGRPVVLTGDRSGNAENLIDESRGVLVPIDKVRDVQYVADALDICLTQQYDRLAIRRWAIEHYDEEKLRHEEADRYHRLTIQDGQEYQKRFSRISRCAKVWLIRCELTTGQVQGGARRCLAIARRRLVHAARRLVQHE